MRTATLFTILLVAAPTLNAQSLATPTPSPHVYLGATFLVAQPQADFRQHVGTSYGGSMTVLWLPDANGSFGLRVEGGAIGYGNESKRVPLSPTVGGRVMVDLSTSNIIAFAHAGPQFTYGRGAIRPYVAPSLGLTYIATVSSVSGDDSESFASDTNYDDTLFSYGATGGAYVVIASGKVPIALDLALRYHRNGDASYLVKGGIRDNADGSITLDPVRSGANLVTFQIGASFGITTAKQRR